MPTFGSRRQTTPLLLKNKVAGLLFSGPHLMITHLDCKKKIAIICLTAFLLGCPRANPETLNGIIAFGKTNITIARQMGETYPQTTHGLVNTSLDDYRLKSWQSHVIINSRYEILVSIPVQVDYDNVNLKLVGPAVFYLDVRKSRTAHDGRISQIEYESTEHKTFGETEWKKIYEAKGDLSVIGVKMNTSPLPLKQQE